MQTGYWERYEDLQEKNHVDLPRGIRAFVDLALGVGRGPVPEAGEGEALTQTQHQVSRQRQQLERRKEQIANKERRIKVLQDQLLQSREVSPGGGGLEFAEQPVGNGGERPGIGLKPGDPHYRSWVGRPKNYDFKASIQVSLLLTAGLR